MVGVYLSVAFRVYKIIVSLWLLISQPNLSFLYRKHVYNHLFFLIAYLAHPSNFNLLIVAR